MWSSKLFADTLCVILSFSHDMVSCLLTLNTPRKLPSQGYQKMMMSFFSHSIKDPHIPSYILNTSLIKSMHVICMFIHSPSTAHPVSCHVGLELVPATLGLRHVTPWTMTRHQRSHLCRWGNTPLNPGDTWRTCRLQTERKKNIDRSGV